MSAWSRVRKFWSSDSAFPLHLFVATRVILCVSSWMGLRLVPALYHHEDARQALLRDIPALDGFCRWDCGWFVRIVQEGYATPEHAKVFPLFPLVGWAMERAFGIHHILVFLVLANAASLASYFVLFRIFRELDGLDAARAALFLFVAYPFAFFQSVTYPESIMVLTTSGAILLATRGRHFAAGAALGLGILARHLSLAGGAALLAAHVRQRGKRPLSLILHPSILSLLVPWAMLGLFSFYLKAKVGDPLAFWTTRSDGWPEGEPWWGVYEIFTRGSLRKHPEYFCYLLIGLVPLAGTIALCFRKRYAELAAYSVVLVVVVMNSGAAGMGRYSASIWPAFLPIGVFLSKRPTLLAAVVLGFAMLQGLFFFLFTHQYRIL